MKSFATDRNAKTSTEIILTAELADSIRQRLTLKKNDILREIYANPGIQHHKLAEEAHISISNLSNLITGIKAIEPQLLDIKSDGQAKFYTLTEIANQYTQQKLLKTGSETKIHSFSPEAYSKTLVTEALETLKQFQAAAGSEWAYSLHDLLVEKESDIRNQDLNRLYQEFMSALCRICIHQAEALSEIYTTINDAALVNLIQNKIDEQMKAFYSLEPLFSLEKSNPEAVFKIIDMVFSEFKSELYAYQYQEDTGDLDLISEEQYNNIFRSIITMSSEFLKNHFDKSAAVRHWSAIYFSTGISLHYIAEKCCMICEVLEKGKR